MDYCSSCRRHLNGALVCPGCGAYAPDIAPCTTGGPEARATPGAAATAPATWEDPAADTWYDGGFRDEPAAPAGGDAPAPGVPAGYDEPVSDAPSGVGETAPGDVEGVPVAPQGRAARRRQRARWKKNQRRAVVATAVALVGGGLTVSAMNRGSVDKAQAATAPEMPNTAAAEQQEPDLTRPASTPSDTRTAPRTADTPSKPSPTNVAREPVTTPRTTRQFTRPDADATAGTTDPQAPQAPQAQSVSPPSGSSDSGGGSGTTTEQEQTPAPAATEGTDSQTPPSQSSPAPQEDSPEQLCVLNVLCVG
ncbi:SCO2400 family protein [Streptomyces sp. NPDC001920]